MPEKTIVIDKAYNGPDKSANGGYVSGLLASVLPKDNACKVRLIRPIPLETPMKIEYSKKAAYLYLNGEQVGEAQSCELERTRPARPNDTVIFRASKKPIDSSYDFLRRCYVCGVERDQHQGLNIHPGYISGRDDQVACFFETTSDMAGANNTVKDVHLWCALDCPGYFACAAGKPALLGSMTGQIFAPVKAGDTLRIHAWTKSSSGRKHNTGVALYDIDGELVALSDQIWIEVSSDIFDKLKD